ncbi:MAG: acyltransferase [Gammaproteobacteria bacterium]|nr:acyltransferase [Gammaproteobacteria bacterium]
MQDYKHMILGKTDSNLRFDYPDENRALANSLVAQAHNTIDIFTRDLEPVIYDSLEFVAYLKELALRSKYSKIRILIQDPSRCIKEGHQVLELAQKLTSYIELRKPGYDFRDFNEALLIADNTGFLHKQLADRYEGIVNFNNPMEANEKNRFFTRVWETAEIDPNLRRLYL